MKNLIVKIITFVMNFFGVSIEDLVAYCKSKNKKSFTRRTKLPLEVLYTGGYRSFFVESGKIPIAIICDNWGIAFEDSNEKMNCFDAKEYCDKYSAGGLKWSLPNKESGHLKALYYHKDVINIVLEAFGKKPLNESFYWSSSEHSNYPAWVLNLSDDDVDGLSEGGMDDYYEYGYDYVRPLLCL